MRKTTLMMIASATMLFAQPGAMMPAMQGVKSPCKCNVKGESCTCGPDCQCAAKAEKKLKRLKMKLKSPFLIKHGLPHYTKMLMKHWDDAKLALTAEQKEKLMGVRKATIGSVKSLKPQIMQLRKEIVQASRAGTKSADLKAKVEKLAALQAEATLTHLKCIEDTKAVLSPEQLAYLNSFAKGHGKKKGKGKGMGMQKPKMMMKCAAGKCGMGK